VWRDSRGDSSASGAIPMLSQEPVGPNLAFALEERRGDCWGWGSIPTFLNWTKGLEMGATLGPSGTKGWGRQGISSLPSSPHPLEAPVQNHQTLPAQPWSQKTSESLGLGRTGEKKGERCEGWEQEGAGRRDQALCE
jgi:hypothetical protein